MSQPLATVNISPELIQPVIEQHIKAAMIQALGSSSAIIDACVGRVLYDKVNHEGRKGNYDSDNKYSYVDIVFRQTIERTVKEEVQKWANENTEQIRAAIVKMMSQKKNVDSFAKAMIEGVQRSITGTYSANFSMNFKSE